MRLSSTSGVVVAILCVCLCLSFMPTRVTALDECAVYRDYYCASVNGSCYRYSEVVGNKSTFYAPSCPSGTYASTSYGEGCLCKPVTYTSVTLGSVCSTTDTTSDNAVQCIQKNPQNGDANYYWHSQKYEGDTCSGAFDCLPPARCVSGKCVARLARGDVCYNATVSLTTSCPIQDYCPSSGDTRVCTARLAAGAECTSDEACPTYLECLKSPYNASAKICRVNPFYWIPAGQRINYTSAQCISGLYDENTFLCVDYDTAYNTWSSTYKGISCSSYTACGTYGTCTCTYPNTRSTASTCQWLHDTPAVLAANNAASIARRKAFYDAGCPEVEATIPSNSNVYCTVALGYYESPAATPCDSTTSDAIPARSITTAMGSFIVGGVGAAVTMMMMAMMW